MYMTYEIIEDLNIPKSKRNRWNVVHVSKKGIVVRKYNIKPLNRKKAVECMRTLEQIDVGRGITQSAPIQPVIQPPISTTSLRDAMDTFPPELVNHISNYHGDNTTTKRLITEDARRQNRQMIEFLMNENWFAPLHTQQANYEHSEIIMRQNRRLQRNKERGLSLQQYTHRRFTQG